MNNTAANISVRLLAHPFGGGFSFFLLMLIFGLSLQPVAAQVDSTQVQPKDSTVAPAVPPVFEPGKKPQPGKRPAPLTSDSPLLGRAIPDSASAVAVIDLPETDTLPKKAKKKIRLNVFRYYIKDDKPRMEIKLPWRTLDYPSVWAFSNEKTPPYNPKVASSRAMLIPGWGQYYNRSYWKLPIVYGGLGTFAFLFSYNNDQYQTLRQAYIFRTDDNPATIDTQFSENIPDSGILSARDQARRNRDFTVIVSAGWWALSIIEAFVDAHLKGFDVSEDLTLDMKPSVLRPLPGSAATVGAGFTLGF
jgi:hypothetical protein